MNPGKIGIDLGVVNSCCAAFKHGRVEIIPYVDTTRTIPSYVYYNPDTPEIIVGNPAKCNVRCFDHIIYDSKQFIGKKYDDPEVQEGIKHWPFNVIKGGNNEPLIELKHNCSTVHLTAVDISSEILKKIKESADVYFDQNPDLPTEAVITVPAYFNNQQRRKTIEAAEKANLKVKKIINEPTAAAISYAYQRIQQGSESDSEENILVYDLGEYSFDVSIIRINYKTQKIKVIATDGDSHLGGEDINQNLVKYFHRKYKQNTGKELTEKQLIKLKIACNKAKNLINSEDNEDTIIESEILEEAEVDTSLSRACFNQINEHLFTRTINIVERVIGDVGLINRDINNIILVGESSKIPKVQELLHETLPSTVICKDIRADEVVAYGACLYANLDNMHFEVQDIITHTISTDIEYDGRTVLYPLIPKNTPLPYTSEKPICFANYEENTDHIDISVFEGEGKYPTDKGIKELKSVPFRIPIPNAEAGKYIIETKYKVDENGVLTIEVKDRQTGRIENLQVDI